MWVSYMCRYAGTKFGIDNTLRRTNEVFNNCNSHSVRIVLISVVVVLEV